MPREISGLRIARSFITPNDTAVSRELDFQLGARQGIAIQGVLGSLTWDPANTTVGASLSAMRGSQTLHLETGSLETVPDAAAEDEDTTDSEIFYEQVMALGGQDDNATEFRASLAMLVSPTGLVTFSRPIFSARNITHRGITTSATLDMLGAVLIYYVYVEFSLSELGLILARRT